MTSAELHEFYEDFVRTLRDRGVVCAITSGLACVHYGIAETTKDCDLLCHPESFDTLLQMLTAKLKQDARLRQALLAERHYWQEPDRLRIRVSRSALRPFVDAMGKEAKGGDLREQHAARVACAERTLAPNPVKAYGSIGLSRKRAQQPLALSSPDCWNGCQTFIRTLHI